MTCITSPPVWHVDRASDNLWVGPITVTVTADGSPVDPADILFALVEAPGRPDVDTVWTAPAADPDESGNIGVVLTPVACRARFGVWVQVTVNSTVDVIGPNLVGWIIRT